MTESFEDARIFAQVIMSDCDAPIISRLQRAHEHEMEQLRRSRFREGYEAGQRSMDAEHYAVALRLKHLPLDEDSHGNLCQIARAIWHSDFGWTKGACTVLRDELVRLLGGVHDDPAPTAATCGACDADCDCHNQQPQAVAYDVLGNERHEAVRRLREWAPYEDSMPVRELWEAIMGEKLPNTPLQGDAELDIVLRDRLIHLLGGDEPAESLIETLVKNTEELSRQGKVRFPPNADGSLDSLKTVEETAALIDEVKMRADQSHESSPMRQENETGNGACENCRITDELRKFVESEYSETIEWYQHPQTLIAIADRIDEQFNRICWQQEAVLQQTIDTMVDERDEMQRERDEWRRGAEHEADKCKEYKGLFERYKGSYVEYVGRYNIAVREREELRKSLRMIAERIGVPHHRSMSMYGDEELKEATLDAIDSKNKHIGTLECQRDELRTELEDTRAALRLQFIADREAARRIGALHG